MKKLLKSNKIKVIKYVFIIIIFLIIIVMEKQIFSATYINSINIGDQLIFEGTNWDIFSSEDSARKRDYKDALQIPGLKYGDIIQIYYKNGTILKIGNNRYIDYALGNGYNVFKKYKAFTLTYNLNGGSGNITTSTFNGIDGKVIITKEEPIRNGYKFLGWEEIPDATISKYNSGRTYMTKWENDKILYAVWKNNQTTPPITETYTLTYNTNGGSGGPNYITFNGVDGKITISTIRPTRSGHTFLGWSTSSSASTASHTPGVTYYTGWKSNKTLYAVWKKDVVTYTLTYNANGGSGGPSSTTFNGEDGKIIISTIRPTRSGYTFLGWSTSSNASTVTYSPGGTYYTGWKSNQTLYAVWKKDVVTYTLTYNANGGSGGPNSSTFNETDTTIKISTAKPIRAGYTFLGWSTSSSASTETYISGRIYSISWKNNQTLYAVWKKEVITYILTYNSNGGSGGPSPTTFNGADGKITIASVRPIKAGYTFLGWSTSPSASSVTYSPGETYNISWKNNQTLYAVWKNNQITPPTTEKYTLTYNANGGSGGPVSILFNGTDPTIRISTVTPVRSGYTFLGWSISSSASLATYLPGETYNNSWRSNQTLYAVWKKDVIKYKLTYNANGGNGGPGTTTFDDTDVRITISGIKPTRSGYTFLGWSTSPNANSATYSPGGIHNVAWKNNQTLYAVWKKDVIKYKLTYNANGGSGGPGTATFNDTDTTIRISTAKPTRSGYTFLGWSTSSSASSATYSPGETYNNSWRSNQTLYAIWKKNVVTYTLTYNANGGSGGPGTTTFDDTDVRITISGIKPTRRGYTFLGWSTSPNAISSIYSPGGIHNVAWKNNQTLYAVWKKDVETYILTYNANGGSGGPGTAKFYSTDMTIRISGVKPTRSGYTFLGWSLSSNANSATYKAGGIYIKTWNGNKTVYAVWKKEQNIIPVRYRLTYNANGGSGGPSSAIFNSTDTTITISTAKPTRSGYTFLGWSTSSNASVATYSLGKTYNISWKNNQILYAVWKKDKSTTPETYSLTYNANGGSGGPGIIKLYSTDRTIRISGVKPTRSGYTFLGWSTSQNASAATYKTGGIYIKTWDGNRTLYAVWKKNKEDTNIKNYVLRYNANGGSGGPSSAIFKSTDTTITISMAKPTRSGYTFLGWSTSTSASAATYKSGGTYNISWKSNQILYAVWKKNNNASINYKVYIIRYSANGGSGGPSSAIFKSTDTTIRISTATPTRSGYTFLGWSTSSSASVATYKPGGTYIKTWTGNQRLFAVWKEDKTAQPKSENYILRYSANGGSGGPSSALFKSTDTTITISTAKPTKSGYTFLGWSTSSSATIAPYKAGGTYIKTWTGNQRLFAVWKKNKQEILNKKETKITNITQEDTLYDEGTTLLVAKGTDLYAKNIVWTSSNNDVIKIINPNNLMAQIQGLKPGKATIKATINGVTAFEKEIIVKDKDLSDLKVTAPSNTAEKGKPIALNVTYKNVNKNLSTTPYAGQVHIYVKYDGETEANPDNYTLRGNKLTLHKEGNATVYVVYYGSNYTSILKTYKINVTKPTIKPKAISLDKSRLDLTEGDSRSLKATIGPEDATDKTITWSSSDSSIATVSKDGKIIAHKDGLVKITATTSNGKTVSCIVNVKKKTTETGDDESGGGGTGGGGTGGGGTGGGGGGAIPGAGRIYKITYYASRNSTLGNGAEKGRNPTLDTYDPSSLYRTYTYNGKTYVVVAACTEAAKNAGYYVTEPTFKFGDVLQFKLGTGRVIDAVVLDSCEGALTQNIIDIMVPSNPQGQNLIPTGADDNVLVTRTGTNIFDN